MLYFYENFGFAFDALTTNKLRTFFALMGVVIGVTAVIIVGSISSSGRDLVFKELETFGLKSVWVYREYNLHPGRTITAGGIYIEDIPVIKEYCYAVKRISPVITVWMVWAKYGTNYIPAKLIAVNSIYDRINNDSVIKGRFFDLDDVRYRRSVCVIGLKVVKELFGTQEPLYKHIKVGDHKYEVIGILKEKDRGFLKSIGSMGGEDENERVIIPISTYQQQYNTKEIEYIQAEAINLASSKEAAEEIKESLKLIHRSQYAYKSLTMQEYIETTQNILNTIAWIGSIAAAISLLVGGIGIMNIMIATVLERTKEIGIRKALGATDNDIMMQFLMETTSISFVGGLIGTVLGVSIILIIGFLSDKSVQIALEYIFLAFLASMLTGVLSGIYPASRAVSLNPVDALKYE